MSPNPKPQGEPTMKTTSSQRLTTGLGVLLLTALTMTAPNAAVLHGIPGGDCTTLPDGITGTVSDQGGNAAGWWSTSKARGTDTVQAIGTGAARHIEMNTSWYPGDNVSAWYTDYGTTPADTAWRISADLRWAGSAAPTEGFYLFADQGLSTLVFGAAFTGTSVAWTAGSQTGTFTSATGLDNNWRTVNVTYNPLTGQATGTLGAEQLFNVNAGTALLAKAVFVSVLCPGAMYDPAILSADNITSAVVPEPAALGLLALGGALFLRRRR